MTINLAVPRHPVLWNHPTMTPQNHPSPLSNRPIDIGPIIPAILPYCPPRIFGGNTTFAFVSIRNLVTIQSRAGR